ncbi:helix-turn-helix transcriptional regulator [Flavobacteriaceae bacterium]|nr:helix-turn-helix transcriptional regulator [Flavobacteriaceae bacterium]
MENYNIHTKIGQKIKEIRNNKNLSQEKLANIADIDRTYLPDIEKGNRKISIQILNKITTALEISLSDFFKDINL